jgi:acetyl esterase/lipase
MQKFNFIILIALSLSTSIYSQENETFTQEEVIYGRKYGMALTMVVLKPEKPNGKGIISVVSGSWYSGYNQIKSWALDSGKPFIDNGYTVFLTMHGSNPRFDISDAVSDLKRAVQFVRYSADDFNVDPKNIGITGASSGGHLSLVVGTSDDIKNVESEDPVERVSSKVQAVAVFYPPTDFLNWGQPNAYMNYIEHGNLLGPSLGAFKFNEYNETTFIYEAINDPVKLKEVSKSVSPAHLITNDDAPTYIIHGDKDATVPLQQSTILQEKFDDVKLPFELIIVQGADHGWKKMNEDRLKFVKWFDKYLK